MNAHAPIEVEGDDTKKKLYLLYFIGFL